MAEIPMPPTLKRLEKGNSQPGQLAYRALHMAGASSLPIPTEMIRAVASECFDVDIVERRELRHELDLTEDRQITVSQVDLPSYNARYATALALGKRLFEHSGDARLFARSILAPQFIVEKEVSKYLTLENIAKLALKANIPTEVAIDKLRDVAKQDYWQGIVIAGFRQNPRADDKGFIWTTRGTRNDATRVSENAELLFERERSVFLARTEHNGNLGIYRFYSGNKLDFDRPGGEKEILIQFNFGKKTGELLRGSEQIQWILSQNSPTQLVIPLDPLEGFNQTQKQ